jgi:hypothetical protein
MKPCVYSIVVLLMWLCKQELILPGNPHVGKHYSYQVQDIREFFADSLHVGRKSHNKIELVLHQTNDSGYVVIKFYTKQNGKWRLRNKYQFERDAIIGCDTKLQDFNNDGLNDMTYISAMAARGANEVRRLFIYDKINDKLIYMKNSEEYPNMRYNKELNCIDAFAVYGGCMTSFLKINGNYLHRFASVELSDGLTVRKYDNKGVEKVIYRDPNNKAGYVRYKNYQPLKVADEY